MQNYNTKKLEFKEAGKVNTEKKVREMLLFHGTDAANIDSILKGGFNLDFNPTHKKKRQLLGRGIYMAAYLIFVIFFTQAKFLENKIYTEKTRKLRQNTQ